MTVQVGVIGAGLMGTTHVETLTGSVPGAQIGGVSDAVSASAERLAHQAGDVRVYPDGLELIHDPGIDAVIIASPGPTHEEFALACLQAGKPVLCEKPLAVTPRAARRVVDAEVALDRRLVQVGFMRRFDPGYRELRSALAGGAIGRPLIAYSTHRAPTVPEAFDSEMIIKDTVVHDIDTVRWLLGQELVKVSVLTPQPTSRAPAGVQDPQIVSFETAGGALVHVEAFVRAQYGYDIRCELVGEEGTLALTPPAAITTHRDGESTTSVPMRFQERFAAAYVAELRAWVASMGDAKPTGASAWDGYAAAVICQTAWEALAGRRSLDIAVEDPPDLYTQPRELALSNH